MVEKTEESGSEKSRPMMERLSACRKSSAAAAHF